MPDTVDDLLLDFDAVSSPSSAESEAPAETAPSCLSAQLRAEMTRAHFSRLRFYWANQRSQPSIQGGAVDLDLQRLGLTRLTSSGDSYVATELGAAALAEQSVRERSRRSPHHELGGRLAQWLQGQRRLTWEGVEFRARVPAVYERAAAMGLEVPEPSGALFLLPRPDVYSVVQTFYPERISPLVHEVKVSRADFLADVAKPLKRLAYACIADAVHYVMPAGLVEPHEVPANCGLIVEVAPGEFKTLVRAKKQRVAMTPENFMNLVIKPRGGGADE